MAHIILKNDAGNLAAYGPYVEQPSEAEYIMRHGVTIELAPFWSCDAVVNINDLRDLLQAAFDLHSLISQDESRSVAWEDELMALDRTATRVRDKTMEYFKQNFTDEEL